MYLIMIMFYKKGFLKNPAKFTTKFMWTTASGISDGGTIIRESRVPSFSLDGQF